MPRPFRIAVALLVACLSSAVRAEYTAEPLPGPLATTQLLDNAGDVLLPAGNTLAIWHRESGLIRVPSPDGANWVSADLSPRGRFIASTQAVLASGALSNKVYTARIGSGALRPLVWPVTLPANIAPPPNPGVGGAGSVTICAFQCNPGLPITLPPYIPSPPRFDAKAINDRGTVVGAVWVDPGSAGYLTLNQSHAIRLSVKGVLEALPQPGLQSVAVNARGDALLAQAGTIFGMSPTLAVWTATGQVVELPPLLPGQYFAQGAAMNDRGQVAGSVLDSGVSFAATTGRAFVWSSELGSRELATVDGFPHASVHAMNSRGQIVGSVSSAQCDFGCVIASPLPIKVLAQPPIILTPAPVPLLPAPVVLPGACVVPLGSSRAVLWTARGNAVDLTHALKNTRTSSAICQLIDASAINDAGQMLVHGIDRDGMYRSYLLSPLDNDDGDDSR